MAGCQDGLGLERRSTGMKVRGTGNSVENDDDNEGMEKFYSPHQNHASPLPGCVTIIYSCREVNLGQLGPSGTPTVVVGGRVNSLLEVVPIL